MEAGSKLDVALDSLVNDERRPRGGGRYRGAKRYSSRRDEAKPYSRAPRDSGVPRNNGASATPGTRVYVGNLSWQTSWQDLKDHMRKAGNVVRADIFLDETGRSKGCGIVEYSTVDEAQNAIKTLNDTKLDDTDRLIFVREDREDRTFAMSRSVPVRGGRGGFRGGAGRGSYGGHPYNSNPHQHPPHSAPPPLNTRGRQVFVGNLPYTCSWQDLKDQFRQCGNIIRADILLDTTGRSKGQGTILFESTNDAQKAIRLFDNTDFHGRAITVHEDKFAQ